MAYYKTKFDGLSRKKKNKNSGAFFPARGAGKNPGRMGEQQFGCSRSSEFLFSYFFGLFDLAVFSLLILHRSFPAESIFFMSKFQHFLLILSIRAPVFHFFTHKETLSAPGLSYTPGRFA
jgi:hypothetical protein